jgi:hypothetical protein
MADSSVFSQNISRIKQDMKKLKKSSLITASQLGLPF